VLYAARHRPEEACLVTPEDAAEILAEPLADVRRLIEAGALDATDGLLDRDAVLAFRERRNAERRAALIALTRLGAEMEIESAEGRR
jgi:hypothetical protein